MEDTEDVSIIMTSLLSVTVSGTIISYKTDLDVDEARVILDWYERYDVLSLQRGISGLLRFSQSNHELYITTVHEIIEMDVASRISTR